MASLSSTPIAAPHMGGCLRVSSPGNRTRWLRRWKPGEFAEFTWPTARGFFTMLRTHTIEGMFADPIYGGNKDFAGWKLIGFPGAQPFFTKPEIQSRDVFTRAPMTGLKMQAPKPRQRG